MLQNDLLKDMSLDDLNQRYKGTFVAYDGKAYYCDGFTSVDADDMRPFNIKLTSDAAKNCKAYPFMWELLDTSRPQSRWYDIKDPGYQCGVYPAFLSLSVHRQWARGINGRNSNLWLPHYDSKNSVLNYERILLNQEPAEFRRRASFSAIRDALKEKGFFLHAPKICSLRYNGEDHIFYRRTVIGKVGDKSIEMVDEVFTQEIREVIENPNIEIVEPARLSTRESPRPKRRAGQVLDMDGIRRAARVDEDEWVPGPEEEHPLRIGTAVAVTRMVRDDWTVSLERGLISRGSVCPPELPYYRPFQLFGADHRQRYFQMKMSGGALRLTILSDVAARQILEQIDADARHQAEIDAIHAAERQRMQQEAAAIVQAAREERMRAAAAIRDDPPNEVGIDWGAVLRNGPRAQAPGRNRRN